MSGGLGKGNVKDPCHGRNALYLVRINANFLVVIWTIVFQDGITGEN